MHRVIASLVFVAGLVVCPETMWAQAKRPTAAPVSSVLPVQKGRAVLVVPKQRFRKSITIPPSQPIEQLPFYGSSIGSKGPFKWIPPGTFQMGSSSVTDPDRYDGETPHKVTLTKGFWLLDHEVTQKEYQAIKGYNPSHFVG
jgi:formylglycine-generating enzyme required for sulfatase activity